MPPVPPSPIDPLVERIASVVVFAFQHPKLAFDAILASAAYYAFHIFLICLSVVFAFGIFVVLAKTIALRKKINKETALRGIKLERTRSKRWDGVLKQMESENPADWKLAIIEADSMLEAMVRKFGYTGSLGEMLKKIDVSEFNTINEAWQAHKVRNHIAHQGASFLFSKRQAKLTIELYEKVFKEFDYI